MDWTEIIITFLGAVIAPSIILVTKEAIAWFKQKNDNSYLESALSIAEDTIEASVLEVSQIFVDGIKGTDGWNKETMAQAATQAKEKVLSLLGDAVMETLNSALPSAEDWITTQIEAAVKRNK